MTTRTIQFFMMPVEFMSAVRSATADLNLWIILTWYGGSDSPQVTQDLDNLYTSNDELPDRIFFVPEKPTETSIKSIPQFPAKYGAVLGNVPRQQKDILYIAELSFKSEWIDDDGALHQDQKRSNKLFRKLAPYFQNHLKFPIWAMNTVTNKTANYSNVGYTSTVEEWVAQGRSLMQPGVENVRFFVSKHTV
jgi:hypothetical protein